MDNITKKVEEEIKKGYIGSNHECPYHPSHFTGQDCTFCYCPFYPCNDNQLGQMIISRREKEIWACTYCLFIHRPEVAKFIMSEINRLGITTSKDPRMQDIFLETKKRFFHIGKALMILGATSDAGKSITVAAICRLLHRRGYLVSPFKSQNMSLNSKVTAKGSEIAMIQVLQSKAAGLKNPDHHMNPILLKPKGDTVSQVMVEGEPFGDYNVEDYYNKFVPGPGKEIVRKNIDFLKERYDVVVMEGAGSPAEINIYDQDIANMRAAEIADANCILVVNTEWGGSFAYAVGTVELIPEIDRKRIKGIILNNIRGDPKKIEDGARLLENIIGIPVIGIIPHIKLDLPSEDSEAFRGMHTKGNGKIIVSVIKFPRIANFTDLDPLFMEDTTVKFISNPEELKGSDVIILPGTKNTIDDLLWMRANGLETAISELKGKIPILGICGGYQMMGKYLKDPAGIEGKVPQTLEGMGFFDNITEWNEYKKKVIQDNGIMIETGEPITGYEIHMGLSTIVEKPLFEIDRYSSKENEGSVREKDLTFGTYLHGVFDKPAFRKYFLSFVKHDGKYVEIKNPRDYDELLEDNINILADGFEKGLNIEKIIDIAGVKR